MLLALDSSTECISAGVKENDIIIREEYSKRDQSEKFPTLINELVRNFSKITGVVVGVGPGSLTGTRIAISIAKGIAQARKIPILGISSLEAQKEYLRLSGVNSYSLILDKRTVFNKSQSKESLVDMGMEEITALQGLVIDNADICGAFFHKPSGFARGLLELSHQKSLSYSLENMIMLKPIILKETKFLTEEERRGIIK